MLQVRIRGRGGQGVVAAAVEARRCKSCGNCFDFESDNCGGVCPDNAVVEFGAGRRFQFNSTTAWATASALPSSRAARSTCCPKPSDERPNP